MMGYVHDENNLSLAMLLIFILLSVFWMIFGGSIVFVEDPLIDEHFN